MEVGYDDQYDRMRRNTVRRWAQTLDGTGIKRSRCDCDMLQRGLD